mmetsp:Transcript_16054/g.38370  ORF Transcript_16054/g.38370 Transcript_16054/m.38370 type:complete len:226 (-) Transcript_16054:30-707(-)
MRSEPTSAPPSPERSALRCTTKGCGRCLRRCSNWPACTGSSTAMSFPLPALTHERAGTVGADSSHGEPPPIQRCTAGPALIDAHPSSVSGRRSRSVIHEMASKVALLRESGMSLKAPSGQPAASASLSGTLHRSTCTAAGAASAASTPSCSAAGGVATAASAKATCVRLSSVRHHWPRTVHATARGLRGAGGPILSSPPLTLTTVARSHGRHARSSSPSERRGSP